MAAEQGAHLTSTTTTAGDGQDVPSIFEVLAQENLMTSLRPAIKHVARVGGSNLSSRLCDYVFENPFFSVFIKFLNQIQHTFNEKFPEVPGTCASVKT